MKHTSIYINLITVLAAGIALVSCAKQNMPENGNSDRTDGTRKIAVSFANGSTKSALEGLQPKFVATDVIKVSNGSATEDCPVDIDGSGNASITTELTGALTMVYPAAAAKMNGNAIEGVLVPTVQDGTFASANICKATIAAGATEATFENQTAVFKLFVPANDDEKGVDYVAKSVSVESIGEENIADGSKKITVGDGTKAVTGDDGFCYVSVLSGETASNIYVCAGEGARKLTGDDEIAAETMYSVALPVLNGHEYVEIEMDEYIYKGEDIWEKVGTKTYKWATKNVGAETSTDFGDYFAWGAVEKAYSRIDLQHNVDCISPVTFFDTKPASYKIDIVWDPTRGFNFENCPFTGDLYYIDGYYPKPGFTKYVTQESKDRGKDGYFDDKEVLDPEDDVASVNWGGSWRMPTYGEFEALCAITYVYHYVESFFEWTGCTFGASPAQIYLPCTGLGANLDIINYGWLGNYWSSSVYYYDSEGALSLEIGPGFVDLPAESRCMGYTVRPISE